MGGSVGVNALVSLALVSSILSVPAAAETPSAPAQQESAPVVQPIPQSLISVKMQETQAVLEFMRDRHGPDAELDAIRGALPAALDRAQELLASTEGLIDKAVSTRDVAEMERRVRRVRTPIVSWHAKLQRRGRSIDHDLQTLLDLRSTWVATLAGLDSLAPPQLLEVPREAIDSITAIETRFLERRAEVFTVEGQVGRAENFLDEGLQMIEAARTRARMQLSVLDVPPLWSVALHPPFGLGEQLDQATTGLRNDVQEVREFVVMERKALIACGALFLVLLAIAIQLGRRMRKRHPEQDMGAAVRILSRPVSAATIAAALVTTLALPGLPFLVLDVGTTLLFIPLFRVLPPWIVRHTYLLSALVALRVLSILAELAIYLSPLQRFVLVLQCVLALWVLVPMLRRSRRASDPTTASRRLVLALQWIAFGLVSIALLANIVGNASLASLTMRGVVRAAYLGLALYGAFLVVEALLRVVFRISYLRKSPLVRNHEAMLHRRATVLLGALLVFLWVQKALQAMLLWGVVTSGVRKILAAQARFGEFAFSLGDIVSFAVTVGAAVLVSRAVRFILAEEIYPRVSLPRGLPYAISTGVHYILVLCGFFLAVAATGIELSKFTIIASAFGLGVGFGLQNVINNFVSGLILMVERPIMPGDSVQIGQTTGEVKRIGMRSSTVRTFEGAEVIVPNANLIANEVVNWTLSDRQRRIDVNVGVEYGSDPQTVIDLLVSAGARHPDVAAQPPPSALFIAFGDSSLDFQLRVWSTNIDQWMRIRSDVAVAALAALSSAGIAIPFPQRDVHIKSMGTAVSPDSVT